MMKRKIANIISEAAQSGRDSGALPGVPAVEVVVEEPNVEAHGDFSSNLALTSARALKMAPRKIAEAIVDHIRDPEGLIEKMEIAGPGFVNFFLKPSAWYPVLREIHETGDRYGASDIGGGEKVQVEFVSSNPTGPLHVGHGRGAAVGDSVANILAFCGHDVQREYYINDSGRQIHTLGLSVFLRYRQSLGETVAFPEDCYQGDYIREYAERIREQKADALLQQDPRQAVAYCAEYAADLTVAEIREDLLSFGVAFDKWFSEQSLYDRGVVDAMIEDFKARNLIYEKDGALWFHTASFGDEKDRVVVRQNGQTTYFASDIAYHQEKFDRGFDRVIDVWGADHHGYIPRMKAAVAACGRRAEQFQVILVQLVNLLRGGEPVTMSTRAGRFVTLKDVVDEVGADAARFLFLTRHSDSPLDFDLELAKKKSNDNPVYYVQYVHARISSIGRKAEKQGLGASGGDDKALSALKAPEEIRLIKVLARYPGVLEMAARLMEPHRITYFLLDLAAAFHTYYNKHRVLSDDLETTAARLYLIFSVRSVIRNGLALLGVSAPERM